jgi:hypothetical protein
MTTGSITPVSRAESQLVICAVRYLRNTGEQVEATGLGLYRINGSVCQARELVAYAEELRSWDYYQPLSSGQAGQTATMNHDGNYE